MGVVKKRGEWWIDFRFEGRRYRRKVGLSKAVADKVWAKTQADIAENKFLDVRKIKKVRFRDFAGEFVDNYCRPNHRSPQKSSESRLKQLMKVFGNYYLHEITPLHIERYKMERLKSVSPATVNRELATLKCLYNRAIDWTKFDGVNPSSKVRFLKENNTRLRYLEKEDISRLLEHCQGILRVVVIVALNTGMRKGEILKLKWRDIDFRRDIIYLLDTKNGEKREVPMNEAVKEALISVRKHPESPYIFSRKSGEHVGDVRKSFGKALRMAGIRDFRFHDLRHTFASQLVMAGVDLNTVRELLGHKSLQMTLRYSHLSPDHKKRAVQSLTLYSISDRAYCVDVRGVVGEN